MSGPENTFIASVHKHMPPVEVLYHMKNHNQYNGGIADCWYSARFDLWIEYKFIVVPKRDTTMIDLHAGKKPSMSVLQRDWLRDRYKEGRNVWVIIGSKDGGVVHTQPDEWESTYSASRFKYVLMPRKEIARMITEFVRGG